MKANMLSLLVMFSFLVPALALGSEANNVEKHNALDKRQRSIIPIAGFTADGDINRLKSALEQGLDTIPPPAQWQLFSPAIDTFLKQHLFADLFVRDVISHQDRELTTIAVLANMTGTEGQLRFHLGATMNTGLTEAQMKDFISVLQTTAGKAQAESAQKILTEVLNSRKKRIHRVVVSEFSKSHIHSVIIL